MTQLDPILLHFMCGRSFADTTFLDTASNDPDIHAVYFSRAFDGMLAGVDAMAERHGNTDEAQIDVMRQAAINGFADRWTELCQTAGQGCHA